MPVAPSAPERRGHGVPLMRLLVALCFLGIAPGICGASPADPGHSTFDPILVGNSSGRDMGNAFRVVVRDVGDIPLAGRAVSLHFLTSPARPCAEQDSGTMTDCAAGTLWGVSNGQGEVVFHARVAGYDDNEVVEVRSDRSNPDVGVLLGHILVRSTDLDGDGATDLADLYAFRERFLGNPAASETDFNRDGTTNILDFALLRDEYIRNVRGTVCP